MASCGGLVSLVVWRRPWSAVAIGRSGQWLKGARQPPHCGRRNRRKESSRGNFRGKTESLLTEKGKCTVQCNNNNTISFSPHSSYCSMVHPNSLFMPDCISCHFVGIPCASLSPSLSSFMGNATAVAEGGKRDRRGRGSFAFQKAREGRKKEQVRLSPLALSHTFNLSFPVMCALIRTGAFTDIISEFGKFVANIFELFCYAFNQYSEVPGSFVC